ncbi:unnamed protein product, partial [Rotaria sp. Silwood1]
TVFPNLKVFSLHSRWDTHYYNELFVPLLHRIFNLEELDLDLVVWSEKRFIDGYDLKSNIINHLLRLNKFLFNIRSCLSLNEQISLSSNKGCQLSFKDFKHNKVISCIDYFSAQQQGQCHVYSYPYQATYYESITNNFSCGLFKSVCEVSLYDERPFEHEFFMKIAKSFPFMQKLTLYNNKFDEQSKDDNRHLSIIEYPYLTHLDLNDAHDEYAEQFLLDIKTSFRTMLKLSTPWRTAYGDKYTVTLIHEDSVGPELMQHAKVAIRCVRAPIDFEDIPLSSHSVPSVVESLKTRFAFEIAKHDNRKKVTAVHKANIMKLSDGLFIDCCREVAAEYPDIKFNTMIVSNTRMQLVNRPTQFDVMVMPNLYENIVSNVWAGLVGGLGTGNTGVEIAGKNIANQSGILFAAAANMLKYLGLEQHCSTIKNAVINTIQEHKIKTPNIGGTSTTTQFVECVLNEIVKMTLTIGFNYEMPKPNLAYYLILLRATELDTILHRKISKNLCIQRDNVSLCIAIINMEEHSNGNYRIYSISIVIYEKYIQNIISHILSIRLTNVVNTSLTGSSAKLCYHLATICRDIRNNIFGYFIPLIIINLRCLLVILFFTYGCSMLMFFIIQNYKVPSIQKVALFLKDNSMKIYEFSMKNNFNGYSKEEKHLFAYPTV